VQHRRIAISLLTFKLPLPHFFTLTLSIRLPAERLQRTTWLVRGITFAVRSRLEEESIASRLYVWKPREMVIGTCPEPIVFVVVVPLRRGDADALDADDKR
jgi:hypothetical protein